MKLSDLDDQAKNMYRQKVSVAKYPLKGDINPYIGIELEYASALSLAEVSDLIIEHDLQDSVRVMNDNSIRVNEIYKYKVEFCILTKWTELKDTLIKLKPIIFDKPQYFSPNTSCGLHVHLDMRHDNPNRVFRNLTSMQSLLFDLVAGHRKNNTYCIPVETTDFDDVNEDDDDLHYHAISKGSYFKQKTIEVRIHQSTLSLTQIDRWITLLKRIADYNGENILVGDQFTLVKNIIKVEPELIRYIEEQRGL